MHHAEPVDGGDRGAGGRAGLGTPVVRALGTVNIPMGIEAGMSIVLLAIVLDRVFRSPERKARLMPAVVFDHVDIVFGDSQAEALALIDRGATRDEILKATDVVLGAAGVDLAVDPARSAC